MNAALQDRRKDFYDRAGKDDLAPLWAVLHGLVPRHPESPALPHHWRFDQVRPYLMEAAELIGTAEAERRVLILENPGLRGQSKITRSLYAGLQIVMPGETAPVHRHAASALRFVIEGQGAFTTVDGERTYMSPGDFVTTPSWVWHEHGNPSSAPIIWMDCLDIHMVNLMDCGFREDTDLLKDALSRPTGASTAEAGHNMLPMETDRSRLTSPIFNYPYARTREALHGMSLARDPVPLHGHKMRYINPLNGDWAMPTLATWAQLLPRGFSTRPARSTDGTVLVVVEGRGVSRIGDREFHWGPKDILVVPSWIEATHRADEEAVFFGASDRVVQEKLGIWRERVSPA